jgi:hypothetical protein
MRRSSHCLLLAVALLTPTVGCRTPNSVRSQREQLITLLQREMRRSSGWARIHAADALLDHHEAESVSAAFRDETETAQPPYRIGVWRVMARASASREQRLPWVGRLRSVMLDVKASDRLSAAESLAKLGVSLPADSMEIETWIAAADDAAAPFALWLLVLSSPPDERSRHEARLARLLESPDAVARLRSGFALGRLKAISPDSRARLNHCAQTEPADSPARIYLLSAALLQNQDDPSSVKRIRGELLHCLRQGEPAQQLEAATTLGKRGTLDDCAALRELLKSTEPDARIGAASGLLYLMR